MTRPATNRRPNAPAAPDNRLRNLAIALGGLVVVVVIGLMVAFGGDSVGGGSDSGDAGRAEATFGPVEVGGTDLAPFDPDADAAADPALGVPAPIVAATTPDGDGVTIGGRGEPTLVVFLAHWCPHCQAEVPVLNDMAGAGELDGIRTVAVLTGTNADAPNFPPVPWLDDAGWSGEIALDDESSNAALSYGLTGYPYLVGLDADGNVVARISGEQPREAVQAVVEAALGSS